MNMLTETICIKRWQAIALLASSGFALGTILAMISAAFGF